MTLTLPLGAGLSSLVLIGGGEFSFGETREIDERLVTRLPAGRRTVAFLPTASGSAEYAQHFGSYLQTLDSSIRTVNVPVYRGRDTRRAKNLEAIRNAGLVYVGGGVAGQFLTTIRESPTEEALRDASAGGVTIAAIGASAASFGSWTHDARGGSIAGLGWLKDCVVETAFDPAFDEPLRRLMSLPDVQLGIGIPPGTAVFVDAGGAATIAGDGQIAVFRKQR